MTRRPELLVGLSVILVLWIAVYRLRSWKVEHDLTRNLAGTWRCADAKYEVRFADDSMIWTVLPKYYDKRFGTVYSASSDQPPIIFHRVS